MDAVVRAAVMYAALWAILRLSGRRTLAEMTAFDFILILIISEATQQALIGQDYSITNALIVILTLVTIDVFAAWAKSRSDRVAKWMDGVPTVLVVDGKPLRERLKKARISEDDILESARRLQGLERMEQIKYAVLEVSGGVTVIPQEPKAARRRAAKEA